MGVLLLRSKSGGSAESHALTAGVNLMLSEATSAAAQAAGMLTLDGRCKTMDAAAGAVARGLWGCLS